MPRQIDLTPQNLQLKNNPNTQLGITQAQIANLQAGIPAAQAAAVQAYWNSILNGIDQATGLDLVDWSKELQQLFSNSPNLLASLTNWVNTAYNNWVTTLNDLGQTTATDFSDFIAAINSNASNAKANWTTLFTDLGVSDAAGAAGAITTLQNNATASTTAYATLLSSWDSAITGYTNWPTFIAAVEAAWNTYATTESGLASSSIFTIRQFFSTALGISPSTGLMAPTNVSSSTGAADLTADWDAVLQPFQSVANLTSTTAWQNSWSGIEALLGVPVAGVNDVQTISPTTSGTQTITFNGHAATSSIANGATAATVLAALDTIAALNGNISVAGTGPWTVTFSNALAGAAQPLMTTNGTGATVTHTTVGGGGLSSLNTPTQIAPAQVAAAAGGTSLGNDITTHLNAISASAGTTGSTTLAAANAGVQLIANTMATLSAQQSNVSTAQAAATVYGQSYGVPFSEFPNGAFSQAPFSTSTSGSGTGHLSISNGQAVWNAASNGDVSVVGVYINNYVVTITAAGGTFTLSYNGTATSALAYNATPSAVQAALQAISGMPSNNVAVTGSPGAYNIVFGIWGALTANGAALTGTGAAAVVAFQGETNTDYQQLQASIGGLPNGTNSKNYALLRCNAAGTTYVYGLVYLNSSYQLCWEMGCYVAGVHTVLGSGTNAPLNFNFTFRAGVGGNPYRFQGVSGSTVVFDIIDTGNVSQVGAAYRYWGFRSDTANSGQATPAPALYVGCSDNALPVTQGSGFRFSCSSTTQQSISVGTNTSPPGVSPAYGLFPAGFWDTATNITPDITRATLYGLDDSVIIGTESWYLFEIRAQQLAVAATGVVSIYAGYLRATNGGAPVFESLANGPSVTVNALGTTWCPTSFGGNCPIYCKSGDMITPIVYVDTQPGTANALSSLKVFGEANHILTYWSMTRMFGT